MNIPENKENIILNPIEDYLSILVTKAEKSINPPKKLVKITDEEMIIPTASKIGEFLKYNYNLSQLKKIARHYKIKIGGNKNELTHRIFIFLYFSNYAKKIQSLFRGFLLRKFNLYHGPAFYNYKLCTNSSDFVTMEPLEEINQNQFISYKDSDGFIYGFDIVSLYNMIKCEKTSDEIKNPYNRRNIPGAVFENMKKIIKISRILKTPLNLNIEDDTLNVSNEKAIELRALTLFQNIDALGNYSNPQWFLSLDRIRLIKLVRELADIWDYRAQLPFQMKRTICPPHGNPFMNLSMPYMHNEANLNNVRKVVLQVLENMVNNGIDRDAKSLGAFYVLGGLTLVNETAAAALPWLYQSLSYF